jgi:hypothetical protein
MDGFHNKGFVSRCMTRIITNAARNPSKTLNLARKTITKSIRMRPDKVSKERRY